MAEALADTTRIDDTNDDNADDNIDDEDGNSQASSDLRLSYLDDVPLKTRFPSLKPPAPKPAAAAITASSAPPVVNKPLTIVLPALGTHKPLRTVTDILRELKSPQAPAPASTSSAPITRFSGAEVSYSASALQGEATAFASALAESGLPSQPSPPSCDDELPASTSQPLTNLNKSRKTMHDLLETLKNSIDFLFVQEAPIHFVRKLPSTTSELGDDLIGPVTHRDWQCIDKRSVHPDSQVAIYVNKCLSSSFQLFPDFSPSLDPNVLILCIRHNSLRSNYFNLVNVYNRPNTRHSAISSLLCATATLPNIAVIEGDFNLRSPLWDPGVTASSGLAEHLFTAFSDLELNLTNDDGDPTWTNQRGSMSVIDLVFCNDALARISPQTIVDLEGCGRSDHAAIFLAFGKQSPHWAHSSPTLTLIPTMLAPTLPSQSNNRGQPIPDSRASTLTLRRGGMTTVNPPKIITPFDDLRRICTLTMPLPNAPDRIISCTRSI
ncbi:hypothetical protein AX14_004951 [Amanita brunnescens Koide BX004]|nr:hypothetical protein AX14_004951 [Amanita brunnescens Koide BX004]